jgi:hypothetical protein
MAWHGLKAGMTVAKAEKDLLRVHKGMIESLRATWKRWE